jgi:hypothetical protein
MIMWTAREFRSFDRHGMAFPGTNPTIRDQMLFIGWSFEGNGATKAFACVPAPG